jgi:hypothetical protein
VQHFRACADVEKSLYVFFVELDGVMPDRERLSQLLHELDAGLQELNVEYAQKRDSRRLGAPLLWVMKSGWFERKAGATLQRGGRDVQFKAQLLGTTPEDPSEVEFVVESANAAP